ncbi:glyoxylate/hydroxypyruvate reductase GhrA [Escherichia coli]|nr:glyoxylate/hydroxypyruvate reductase GhrA [Escherichia coli]
MEKRAITDSADYALVWHPPVEMLQGRALKAVFALGAGVDSILSKLRDHPDMLPLSIPLFRLEDTGMGRQMQEYAVSQVLHWFRRFDDYQALKHSFPLATAAGVSAPTNSPSAFWAPAYWGRRLLKVCNPGGFRFAFWSRSRKSWPQVQSFAGRAELGAFLSQCRVLINLLPNTPETVGIINQTLLAQLPDERYVLNLARGVHVVEDDLLAALNSGKLKGAMLDVFNREPLPQESPLWVHPRVAITPHVAAVTRPTGSYHVHCGPLASLNEGSG